MKANEAPEKLHLLPNGLISYCRNNDEDIEYTRTDAFIEKAREWIKANLRDYILTDIDDAFVGIDGLFLEGFKNYMKGE